MIDNNIAYLSKMNPTEIKNPEDKSLYESNCVEFWAPITDKLVPNIIEDRYLISSQGRIFNKKSNCIQKLSINKGREQIMLYNKDGKGLTRKIGRMVLQTFAPEVDNKDLIVDFHKEGSSSLMDIDWITKSGATVKKINEGNGKVFGVERKVSITDQDVESILKMHEEGMSPIDITNQYKNGEISYEMIKNICNGSVRVAYRKDHDMKIYKSQQ